jgi:hypothetical protein
MKTSLASSYHQLLVTLHWLLAVLIVVMLAVGFFKLALMPNTDPEKIPSLLTIRFIVRICTVRPADAATGYPLDSSGQIK